MEGCFDPALCITRKKEGHWEKYSIPSITVFPPPLPLPLSRPSPPLRRRPTDRRTDSPHPTTSALNYSPLRLQNPTCPSSHDNALHPLIETMTLCALHRRRRFRNGCRNHHHHHRHLRFHQSTSAVLAHRSSTHDPQLSLPRGPLSLPT